MRWLAAAVIMALGIPAANAQSSTSVETVGEVAHPGRAEFVGATRLADVVKAAGIDRDAYVLGAAWLRPSLVDHQTRLKAGLVYELGEIRQTALAGGREPLAELALRMRRWIGSMPITGRQVVRTLEPHALQVSPSDNLPVEDGDRLVYPARPHTIAVVGAVERACRLPQVGLQDVRTYLERCPLATVADADTVFVIEPDGKVFEQGVALWNRSQAMPLAPGAMLYVPLRRDATLHAADAGFNREMAEFLATQALETAGTEP